MGLQNRGGTRCIRRNGGLRLQNMRESLLHRPIVAGVRLSRGRTCQGVDLSYAAKSAGIDLLAARTAENVRLHNSAVRRYVCQRTSHAGQVVYLGDPTSRSGGRLRATSACKRVDLVHAACCTHIRLDTSGAG